MTMIIASLIGTTIYLAIGYYLACREDAEEEANNEEYNSRR